MYFPLKSISTSVRTMYTEGKYENEIAFWLWNLFKTTWLKIIHVENSVLACGYLNKNSQQ